MAFKSVVSKKQHSYKKKYSTRFKIQFPEEFMFLLINSSFPETMLIKLVKVMVIVIHDWERFFLLIKIYVTCSNVYRDVMTLFHSIKTNLDLIRNKSYVDCGLAKIILFLENFIIYIKMARINRINPVFFYCHNLNN